MSKLIVGAVAICLALAGFSSAAAQTGSVAVVVNEKNPVNDLSPPELRKLFTGEKHAWVGGLPVRLFVRAPEADERVVQKSRSIKIIGYVRE